MLVLGGGAREHALAWRLSLDPGVEVVCAPGNAGIAREHRCVPVASADPDAVLAIVQREGVALTVVGPEAPLAAGLADAFLAAGQPLFGPTRAAAQLETSKAFAKEFMARHGVPTARYRVCQTADEALAVLASGELGLPVFVKADGLAAGKGVVVAATREEAEAAVRTTMVERAFGEAGSQVVLEECLVGEEASFFVIADGTQALPLLAAQDHKRIFDGDQGPNTGGMGAFAPSPLVDDAMQARVIAEIVRPVLDGMAAEGTPFRGFLYCGLMLTAAGPQVIEFNCRFGDPEAQVVLPMIAEPLAPLLLAAATGGALPDTCALDRTPRVGVVLAAEGYPGSVRTGQRIDGLPRVAAEHPGVRVFHAGVGSAGDDLIAAGGRVLTVVAGGTTFPDAIARAYAAAACIRFDGMQFRRDIGRKAMAQLAAGH